MVHLGCSVSIYTMDRINLIYEKAISIGAEEDKMHLIESRKHLWQVQNLLNLISRTTAGNMHASFFYEPNKINTNPSHATVKHSTHQS
jgi:hypothetical protein